MAYVSDGHAFFFVQCNLKRKQHQHVRDRGTNRVYALVTPGPDGRADEMHGGNARSLELALQTQVEVRRVYAHKNLWRALPPVWWALY